MKRIFLLCQRCSAARKTPVRMYDEHGVWRGAFFRRQLWHKNHHTRASLMRTCKNGSYGTLSVPGLSHVLSQVRPRFRLRFCLKFVSGLSQVKCQNDREGLPIAKTDSGCYLPACTQAT